MLASAQAARMGQVDTSQEEASTSKAGSAPVQPWRQHSNSRANDTGILLADGDIGSEQHQAEKRRAIEKFYKEKQKRRLLGAQPCSATYSKGPAMFRCQCSLEYQASAKIIQHAKTSCQHGMLIRMIVCTSATDLSIF